MGYSPQPGLDGGEGYPGYPLARSGYPPPRPGIGYPPPRPGIGYPPPWLDGVPPPPQIRQSSIASTCYAAGGMPLAFTQEDFLVFCFFVDDMSRILVGSANNLKLNVLGALQLCKKCRSAASFRRGIRLFHNISVKGSVRESKWTFQQTLHWRHRTRLSPNLKTVVCPLSTSPPQDERNTFKDDPEIKAFMKQIHEDFGVDQEIS